jgi:hypothetical protein
VPNSQDLSLPPSQESAQADPASPSPAGGSSSSTQPAPGSGSWIWDRLGQSRAKADALGGRLNEIEALEDPDLKGFLRFQEYAGPDEKLQQKQPDFPAGEILRDEHSQLMERYAEAKRKGENFTPLAEEFLALSVSDEILQDHLGNDPITQSFLPGQPPEFEGLMADRIFRNFKKQRNNESSIMDLPEWGQLQEWLKANPNGRFEKAPEYAAQVDAGPSRTDRQVAAQQEIGRILNALNSAYHSGVNPKGAIYQGQLVGEQARKLAGLQLPHSFDDAPLWHKLGVGVTEGAGLAAIRIHDFNTSVGMDSFYAAAKLTRALFAPGAPLPEWIENNYHPGSMALAAVISQEMGLGSVPWDNESGMLINQKQLEDRVNESIWLQATSVFGHVAGFVANPILGGSAMAAAGRVGAATATKGIGWIFGSQVAKQYPKLASLLGAITGVSAFNGLTAAIHEGSKGELNDEGVREYEKSTLSNFATGFATGPLYVLAGKMGGKAGDLLLRAQAPTWLAKAVGGIFEGVGFAHMEDLQHGKDSLTWNLMRNPTKENFDKYMVHVGANAMAMGLFHMVHSSPQQQMRDRILKEHGVDIFSDLQELQQKAAEEKESRQIVRASFEQAGEGIAKEHHQPSIMEMLLPKRTEREAYEERIRAMGRRGLQEQEIEAKTGLATEQLIAPKGVEGRVASRDFPVRLLEWNKRRQAAGGEFKQREFGGYVILGKEGAPHEVKATRAEQGDIGRLPIGEVKNELNQGKRAIFFHTHPDNSFFSGADADLGIFRDMSEIYKETQASEDRMPFVVAGTGSFLVATKIPGKVLASEADIHKAFKKARTDALALKHQEMHRMMKEREAKGETVAGKGFDPAAKLTIDRAELQASTNPEIWNKIGLEMNTYTPSEFHSLWRHYLDGNAWEVDPEAVGAKRSPGGIYPDVGAFRPEKMRRTVISPVEKQELMQEPDAEGFRRTAGEITGQKLPPTQAGTMRASEELGVPRPELVGAKEGTYHAEPELPHPPSEVRAPGVPKEPLLKGKLPQPDPSKLQALFHRDRTTQPGGGVLGALRSGMQAVRTYIKDVFHGRRSLMADVRAGRLGAAEAIEKLGYRARFRRLGEFEDRFVAETDRLAIEVGNAERTAGGRFFDALAPLGSIGEGSKDPGAAQALRKRSADDLMELLYLKDFAASAERGEPLPLGIEPEVVEARLKELKPTKEVLQAAANVRALLDQAGEQLVARGVISREHLKKDYMPHRVADFFDAFSSFTPGRTVGKLREAFRGYAKARKGSERMIDTDPEAVVAYLTQVQKDNAVHDFIVRNGEAVHQRMIDTLDAAGIRTDWADMKPEEWKQARQDLHDKGMVIYDSRVGDLGRRNLAQDPVAQTIYREFSDRGEMSMPDILEVGRNIKPNEEKQVYLVPKEVAELWSDIRAPKKSLINSPTLNAIRRQVGQWFKAPALRGILGLKTIPRQGRNLLSDAGAIAFKKTIGETASILKNLPAAHRFSRALTNPEWAKANLTPTEQGLFQEMKVYGSVQGGETFEALGPGGAVKDHPVFKKIYGDWDNWWNLKKHYQGDYKWVRTVDTYSENIFRAAVWLSERSKLIREGIDAESAARAAHLETGRILVNYNHNTPLEANVLNTLAFPFYTWIRHQVTSTVAEGLKRPLPMLAKYGTIQAALMAWNYMMAEDEESKLIQLGHRGVQTPHFWLPWVKDSEGNPMMVSWEMPTDMVARFFGLGGAGSKLGDYLWGHGDAAILWRDLATGGMEESALTGGKFAQDWMAPWFRAAGGWMGFRSKFVMPGELAGTQAEKALTAARPIADVTRLFDDRRSIAQKVTDFLPFGKFVELTEGVPADKRVFEFYAGRQQRHEAQLNLEVKRYLPKIDREIKSGNWDKARSIIEDVWNDQADDLAPLGYTKLHLANRFWNALQNKWRRDIWNKMPGSVSARFHSLNDQQKIAALREMGLLEEAEEK